MNELLSRESHSFSLLTDHLLRANPLSKYDFTNSGKGINQLGDADTCNLNQMKYLTLSYSVGSGITATSLMLGLCAHQPTTAT